MSQERAENAASEMSTSVAELCGEKYGGKFRSGEYAIEIRMRVDDDGITYTWDWYWRPLGSAHGGAAV